MTPTSKLDAICFTFFLYPTGLIIAYFTHASIRISLINLIYILLFSLSFPLYSLLIYRANKDIDIGITVNIGSLSSVIIIIGAWSLLNEKLNQNQLPGAVLIICAASMASFKRLPRRKDVRTISILIAFLSVIAIGIGTVFERWILARIDFGTYLIYGWGAQTMWMCALAYPSLKDAKILIERKTIGIIRSFGILNTLEGIFFLSALKLAPNTSLAISIASFTSVLTVVAAYYLLQEKENMWFKAAAAMLGVSSLALLQQ